MIKNKLIYCTKEELDNNINILLIDDETMNIFIDGKETPDMRDTLLILYNHFKMDTSYMYDEFMWMQAIDFFDDIITYTPLQHIQKINIVIKNAYKHHCKWSYKGNIHSFQSKIKFYQWVLERYEIENIDTGGSRLESVSLDIYLCDDDFDFEEYKLKVNNPSLHDIESKMNKEIKLYETVEKKEEEVD